MQTRIQSVFRSLDPYRLLTDLQVPLVRENGRLFTQLPDLPEERLLVTDHGLVSTSADSDLVACSIFEYLRHYLGSYEQAVHYLIDAYHHLAQCSPGIDLGSLSPVLVEELKTSRAQFNSILALRNTLRNPPKEGMVNVLLWASRRGVQFKHAWRMMYVTQAEQLNQMAHYSPESVDRFESGTYLVFPYLKDPHTYGWLHCHHLANDGSINFTRNLVINPTKHGYLGLHTCLPDIRETHVYLDEIQALTAYSAEMQMGQFETGVIRIGFQAVGEENRYRYSSAIFIQLASTGLNDMTRARTALADMSVFSARPQALPQYLNKDSQPWNKFILLEFCQLLQTDGYLSHAMTNLIDSVKGDRVICEAILRWLENAGMKDVLTRIKSIIDSHQVFQVGALQICETSNGYVAHRIGTAISTPFTNFIIRLDHNVWFEEAHDDALFAGRVLIGGQEFPLLMPTRLVSRPTEIPNVVLASVMAGGPPPQGCFPQVTDSTFQRRLSDVIRAQAGSRPTVIGVKRLGWNDSRTRFVTPTYDIKLRGVAPTSKICYPGSDFLKGHFAFQDWGDVPGEDRVSSRIRYFLTLIASGLIRSFLHMAIPNVPVQRTEKSLRMLQAIFRPFGQVKPLLIGAQRRAVEGILGKNNCYGYPVFCYAADPSFLVDRNQPIFVLGDSGLPFHDDLDSVTFGQIASFSRDLFVQLLQHCIRNPFQVQGLIHNEQEPSLQEMVCEGKYIIEQITGRVFDVFDSDMPYFQAALAQVAFDQAGEFFRYDMNSATAFIKTRRFENFNRKRVFEELQAKDASVRLHGEYYIACPSDFLLELLSRFFGKPVLLFHQELEAESEPTDSSGDSAQSGT